MISKLMTLGAVGMSSLPLAIACGPGHDEVNEVASITGNSVFGMMGSGGFLGGIIVALLIVLIVIGILNLTKRDKRRK